MNISDKNNYIQGLVDLLNFKRGYNISFSGLYKDIIINGIRYKCKEGLYKIKDYIIKEGLQ